MKKYLILTLIFIWLLGGAASGRADVYFLPETGFLQVKALLVMESAEGPLSFSLFPHAQITEFWTDHLASFDLRHSAEDTAVTFSIGDFTYPQTLNLCYEGFLNAADSQVLLDEASLWFPKFSFAILQPTFTIRLPQDWHFIPLDDPRNLEQQLMGATQWAPPAGTYPGFAAVHADAALEYRFESPQFGEFWSKAQIQVNRLTSFINARNEAQVRTLLDEALQEKGLAAYLTELPAHYGEVSSGFQTTPTSVHDPIKVVFSTEKGPRFLASLQWQEVDGHLQLKQFKLTPYQPEIPEELRRSLEVFVSDLQAAAAARDNERLVKFFGPDLDESRSAEFLYSLNPESFWALEFTALEPLGITILVPHSPQLRLLINIGLSAGEENWLIETLDAAPLR